MRMDVSHGAARIRVNTFTAAITTTLIGYLLISPISAETRNKTICLPPDVQLIEVKCQDNQQIRIIGGDLGQLHTYSTSSPCDAEDAISPHDCVVVDGELSETLRSSCNTKPSCIQRYKYDQTPPACRRGYDGPKIINVFHECVPGTDPKKLMDPNSVTEQPLNGTRITLQSADYPQMTDTIDGSSCEIDLKPNTKVKMEIYDLSAYLDSGSPFCIQWDGGQEICAHESQGQIYIAPQDIKTSTRLSFKIKHKEFHGKFWIVLSGVSSFGDTQPAVLTVTCRDAVNSGNFDSLTGTPTGDIGLIAGVLIAVFIVSIIIITIVVRRKRRNRANNTTAAEKNRQQNRQKPALPPKPPRVPPAGNKPKLQPSRPYAPGKEIDEETSFGIGNDDTMQKPSYLKELETVIR